MELSELTAIGPVDGRYRQKTKDLADFFSEHALIKYRVLIEIEYFIALCGLDLENCKLKSLNSKDFNRLRDIFNDFSSNQSRKVKEIESVTNHDVKAVEYFLKEIFDALNLGQVKEFIHFGLTSQDINNTAIPIMIKGGWEKVVKSAIDKVLEKLIQLSLQWKDQTMLAHTHGQPATPTSMGKELYVFAERLQKQIAIIENIRLYAKFGGATGNFNAHIAAYPNIDWILFADRFIERLGLQRAKTTTQIGHYDDLSEFFHNVSRINTILIDLSRDIWLYISMGYFKQKVKSGEVGSSAMPHKINPIDFENAEGNAMIANAVFSHLAACLPISRLQRDLTDSTASRNIGVPFAHTLIALKSVLRGLNKLIIDKNTILADLNKNWALVAEAIQTILRREGYSNPYETLKALTRTGDNIDRKTIEDFIKGLDVSDRVKKELLKITPESYTGIYGF